MAPGSEIEFQKLNQNEAIEAGIQYFRLFKHSEEMNRRLTKTIEKMSNELGARSQQVLWAQEYLDQLKKMKFGPTSERRMDEADGPLFDHPPESQQDEEDEYVTIRKKKRTKFGHKKQPELPVEEKLFELSKEQQEQENVRPMVGQFEESELINVVPVRFIVQKNKRQKYSSKDPTDPKIITAPGPIKLKEGSRYSMEFGVEVGISKYRWHLPLDRQVRIMKTHGLGVNSQTLHSQIDTIAWYLNPHVYRRFQEESKNHRVHVADESGWKNLSKKKQGKKKNKRFTLWALRNEKCTLFEIYDSRSQKVAENFLKDIQGVLVTDGYAVYQTLASPKLKLANDWYHVRRKFTVAEKNFPDESGFFIKKIRKLSQIERKIKESSLKDRLKTRQKESKPIVDEIKNYLDALSTALPESSLGKGVSYTQKLWSGLTLFLEDPEVPFDTNSIERAIRGPVLGRKNHRGSHSLKTAEIAAIWYSVIETCKMHGVDARKYVTATLQAILKKEPVLMPWEFESK
jgi:transposase